MSDLSLEKKTMGDNFGVVWCIANNISPADLFTVLTPAYLEISSAGRAHHYINFSSKDFPGVNFFKANHISAVLPSTGKKIKG